MEPAGSFLKFLRRTKKVLLDDDEDELHAQVRGPLYPRLVLYVLLTDFEVSAMLTMDQFGLLLLNSDGGIRQMWPLNALRVTAVLPGGIVIPSILLVAHYKRLYTYTSEGNAFFTLTFTLSFFLGAPCAIVDVFA